MGAEHTASRSLSLKNSILAKKSGEGILKIFTPFGSNVCKKKNTDDLIGINTSTHVCLQCW